MGTVERLTEQWMLGENVELRPKHCQAKDQAQTEKGAEGTRLPVAHVTPRDRVWRYKRFQNNIYVFYYCVLRWLAHQIRPSQVVNLCQQLEGGGGSEGPAGTAAQCVRHHQLLGLRPCAKDLDRGYRSDHTI